MASWYGARYHGRTTASGESFNMYAMTAAHKTIPFGTTVEVINLDNGKTIEVVINDRGPFVEGRIIDLSQEAARRLGYLRDGVANVRIIWGETTILQEDCFRIQVGSFSIMENARSMKKLLEENNLTPRTQLGNSGTIRIYLDDIPESSCYETVELLQSIGIEELLITQN